MRFVKYRSYCFCSLSALILEKIETIRERYGLEIGAIPPFGKILGLESYFDVGIRNCTEVIFSCGLINESIRMKLMDLSLLIHPQFAKLAKE